MFRGYKMTQEEYYIIVGVALTVALESSTFDDFNNRIGWQNWMKNYMENPDADRLSINDLNRVHEVLRDLYGETVNAITRR